MRIEESLSTLVSPHWSCCLFVEINIHSKERKNREGKKGKERRQIDMHHDQDEQQRYRPAEPMNVHTHVAGGAHPPASL